MWEQYKPGRLNESSSSLKVKTRWKWRNRLEKRRMCLSWQTQYNSILGLNKSNSNLKIAESRQPRIIVLCGFSLGSFSNCDTFKSHFLKNFATNLSSFGETKTLPYLAVEATCDKSSPPLMAWMYSWYSIFWSFSMLLQKLYAWKSAVFSVRI